MVRRPLPAAFAVPQLVTAMVPTEMLVETGANGAATCGPAACEPESCDRELASRAVAALVAEAELTPKPGLVDRRGGGAHGDMDVALMRASATALYDGFARMARAARRHGTPSRALREELAALGRAAERDMFATTGGVNTHRGAVWALGLLTAAAALAPGGAPERLARKAARIARHSDTACPPEALATNGARATAGYGVHGARGQAQAGFPHVTDVALPALRAVRARGAGETTARLDALLALMAALDDTCVLHRGGTEGLRTVQRGADAVLRSGGAGAEAGRAELNLFDAELTRRRLSPGGCADLLAAALLLDGHSLDGLDSPDELHGSGERYGLGGPDGADGLRGGQGAAGRSASPFAGAFGAAPAWAAPAACAQRAGQPAAGTPAAERALGAPSVAAAPTGYPNPVPLSRAPSRAVGASAAGSPAEAAPPAGTPSAATPVADAVVGGPTPLADDLAGDPHPAPGSVPHPLPPLAAQHTPPRPESRPMENLTYTYDAHAPLPGRVRVGAVSSGDLEVLATPRDDGRATVQVTTSVDGFGPVWQDVLDDWFAAAGDGAALAADYVIHDAGAAPGTVTLRLAQLKESATA